MSVRNAHGRAKQYGRLTVSECTPADELPQAQGSETAKPERDAHGHFLPGNWHSRLAKVRMGGRGALLALDAKADPAWRAARNWAKRGAAHRVTEMARLHGGELGSEVCALIADSWEMRGDARYLAARARADANPDLARAAATLLASARQASRDAWELASREAAARPKMGAQGLASLVAKQRVDGARAMPIPVPEPAHASPLTPGGGVELGPPHSPADFPIGATVHPSPTDLVLDRSAIPTPDNPTGIVDPPRCEVHSGSGRQCIRRADHPEPHAFDSGGPSGLCRCGQPFPAHGAFNACPDGSGTWRSS